MGQVTIYLDDQTEIEMNAAIKASGISKSKWVASIIHDKAGSTWPESIVQLDGAWLDFPSAETIRDSSPTDSKRESF
ncbi:MAG: hypothetical protein R8K49_01905 [Mariprofundaceae bacterium]